MKTTKPKRSIKDGTVRVQCWSPHTGKSCTRTYYLSTPEKMQKAIAKMVESKTTN